MISLVPLPHPSRWSMSLVSLPHPSPPPPPRHPRLQPMRYRRLDFSTHSVIQSLWCGSVSVRFEHRNAFKPGSNVFVTLIFSFCIELERAGFVSSRFRMLRGLGGGHMPVIGQAGLWGTRLGHAWGYTYICTHKGINGAPQARHKLPLYHELGFHPRTSVPLQSSSQLA